MDKQFWQSRWSENKIAFHEPKAHEFLRRHLKSLDLSGGDIVFVPLCGKTLDIDWLLQKGLKVVGIEFNRGAIEAVFARLNLEPTITEHGALQRFAVDDLALYLGDFFELSAGQLGPVHAVYDRAALVALPDETRMKYAHHLSIISDYAPQLAIAYSYDQSQTQGPPFSVPTPSVQGLYRNHYRCVPVDGRPIEGPLAARCQGEENALLLVPNPSV